jgi:PAS domain S-box-containing protein
MQPLKQRADESRRTGWSFLLIFVVLASGIISVGYLAYQSFERHFRVEMERQLTAIADLKVSELVQWRMERLGDGDLFFKNPAFSSLVRRYLERPEDADTQRQLQDWIGKVQTYNRYDQIRVVDAQGVTRMSIPVDRSPMAASVLKRIPEILQSGQVQFLDFYRNEHNQRIYLAVMIPLYDLADASRPLGVLKLRIDPEVYLYPFIKRWPLPRQTAETLLVRREGNEVVFLNELRFQTNTALKLRAPLDRVALPAAHAALGHEGVMEGLDYRGVPAVAALRSIPDSPWALVARMDKAEVYAPLRERLWMVLVMVIVLLFGAGAGLGLAWRQQRVRFYQERFQAAESLRESEQSYQALFENMLNGFAYCKMLYDEQQQPVDFVYLAVNKAFEQLTGLKDVVGKPVSVVLPGIRQVSPELFAAYDRVATSGQPESFEFDLKSLKQWLSIAVYRPAQGYFVAVFDNITERKRAEVALLQEKTFADKLLNAPRDTVFLLEPATGKPIRWNQRFAEVSGYTDAEIAGMKAPDDFYDAEELKKAQDYLDKITSKGQGVVELALVTKQGLHIPFEYVTTVVESAEGKTWLLSIGRDVTERKQAETALRESEARLNFALEKVQTGAWDLNLLDHSASRTLIHDRIFGYTTLLPVWTYEIFLDHVLPEDRAEVDRKFREATATQSDWNFECRIRRTDGKVRWIFSAGGQERNAAGKPVRMSGIVQDITERKRIEEHLRQQEQELRDRNAELERFLYTVSHDLKSPVVTVRTFLGYLEQDVAASDAERTKKDLVYIRAAAEKMGRLLDDVLELSRIGRVVSPPVRIMFRTVIEDALHAVAGQIAERGVRVQLAGEDVALYGDRLRLGEIWQNLVENAVKFMGDQPAPCIELGWEARGAERVFFVRDNGIGIEPRFQAKVFGLFEKLDPKAEGTGIGLALVKRIVELNAGRIWLKSAGLGHGTCFYFTLPKIMQQPEEGTKP